ncbi:glycoprotease family-domain-containing protein [Hypoxylon trugodes]|uniref:glycoprotease family-domain-containing protein n=1 Tax=Hypoxylon trugodes TaxID=326681 RepID=UPI002194F949|nr:glycoprotease family-domain-containing protein [Hypoxylon trugodes]KAI1386582.1 glycoprotease family-domain-containing protein [Hypoxylon trugodes]
MSEAWLTPTRPYFLAWARRSVRLQSRISYPSSLLTPLQRCPISSSSHPEKRRRLLTLAIETSCDDTCVAVLEKEEGAGGAAHLRFNGKITSDNREFRGVYPIEAVKSHSQHLSNMVREAMCTFPDAFEELNTSSNRRDGDNDGENGAINPRENVLWVDGQARRKPDFVSVTRGPGMMSNLSAGLNTAKGLAVAWDVPLLGVNHMQAHALTPRLVSTLKSGEQENPAASKTTTPDFPFLSLLVSGGHTLLVLSRSLNDHVVLAEARSIAIGDMLDKCARVILPASELSASENVMYGPLLERFAFPSIPSSDYDYEYQGYATRAEEVEKYNPGFGWWLTPALSGSRDMVYEFSGINGQAQSIMQENPDMVVEERRVLARHTMRLAFEHLISRLCFALTPSAKNKKDVGKPDKVENENEELLRKVRTVVVAGGVASNRYLMRILRATLDARGFRHIKLECPPIPLCTDNAAMIAWTGMEMYEAGWRSELDIVALRKWYMDSTAAGGILGVEGWRKVEDEKERRYPFRNLETQTIVLA